MAKMFWTCRATVCSLMNSSSRSRGWSFRAATRRSTCSSRAVSPCCRQAWFRRLCAGQRRRREPGRARRPVPRRCFGPLPAQRRRRPASPRARQARPTSTRTRATSYGRRELRPYPDARRRSISASLARPSASATAPGNVRPSRRPTSHRKPLRDLIELAASGARRIEAADGEHDLDVGGQHPSASAAAPSFRRRPGESRRPPRPPFPGPAASGRGRAAVRIHAGSPGGTLLQPRRTRRASRCASPWQ